MDPNRAGRERPIGSTQINRKSPAKPIDQRGNEDRENAKKYKEAVDRLNRSGDKDIEDAMSRMTYRR